MEPCEVRVHGRDQGDELLDSLDAGEHQTRSTVGQQRHVERPRRPLRALVEGNDNRPFSTIEDAARSLYDGESYLEGAAWLGLSRHMKTIGPDELSRYPAAVAASRKHAIFASGGQVDRFGEAAPVERGDGLGRSLRHAWAIVAQEQPLPDRGRTTLTPLLLEPSITL